MPRIPTVFHAISCVMHNPMPRATGDRQTRCVVTTPECQMPSTHGGDDHPTRCAVRSWWAANTIPFPPVTDCVLSLGPPTKPREPRSARSWRAVPAPQRWHVGMPRAAKPSCGPGMAPERFQTRAARPTPKVGIWVSACGASAQWRRSTDRPRSGAAPAIERGVRAKSTRPAAASR